MEMQRDCGPLIKQINDELRKNANNVLRAQGMTFAQLEALVQLEQAPDRTRSLKELEQLLHVAQSTVAGIISRLERKGLVEPLADAGDRRIKLVQITGPGLERARAAELHRSETEERLLCGLTREERSIFYTLLKKVHDSLG